MVSGMAIEIFYQKHVELNKHGRHKVKQPWSTNTKDLIELAHSVGLSVRQFRFSTWNTLPKVSIVKVNNQRHARMFHWIACDWSEMYGPKSLLIHDPANGEYLPFTLSTNMREEISTLYTPFGFGLEIHDTNLPVATAIASKTS